MWMIYEWTAAKCNLEGAINVESAEEINEIYLLYESGSIKVKMSLDGHIK